jgi:hypothetical protein
VKWTQDDLILSDIENIVVYMLKARTVKPAEQPLLRNDSVNTSVAKEQIRNTQQ